MIRTSACLIVVCVGLLAMACGPGGGGGEGARTAAPPGARVNVFVSIPPELEFVERVGGERVAVHALLDQRQNPHTFQPTPRQMDRLATADLFFAIGVPFEAAWRERIAQANPRMSIVDLSEGLPRVTLEGHRHDEAEQGGAEPSGARAERDPHVWMDPGLAVKMVDRLEAALAAADPAGRMDYHENARRYREDLQAADRRVRARLADLPSRVIMVFHPALGYFARAYGLEQVAIETEGKSPTARELGRTIDRARAAGVRVVFVEPQFNPRSAQAVAAAIGARVEMINVLAPDYLANLERIAEAVAGEHEAAGPK